jgi:hypothetical protein
MEPLLDVDAVAGLQNVPKTWLYKSTRQDSRGPLRPVQPVRGSGIGSSPAAEQLTRVMTDDEAGAVEAPRQEDTGRTEPNPTREEQANLDRERWIRDQLAKAPPWTEERLARLAVAFNQPTGTSDGETS